MTSSTPTALVTGASSGIGAAIARRLAQEGYRVVAVARRLERLQALAADFPDGIIIPETVDLRQEAEISALFNRTQEKCGGVDLLVNNAGLGHRAPLLSGDTERWREMLEVNVLALTICTREAVQQMRDKGDRGHVINISSMAGHRVLPGSTFYAATKFAVRALTEGLRQELRRAESDIRVSSVSPGLVETEFAAQMDDEEKAKETYGRFPVLQPEDIANAVWYPVSQPDYVQVHDVLVRPNQQSA
ncbi:MAG: SDR family NAD(P)-dependent oxidoreductase [Elainellaceae cyanobacterium]